MYLIQELVDKVQNAKLFTKVDVRKGYNNIRVKEGDKHKAAFKTQFSNLVATGKVVIHMDDILIATPDNAQEHRKIVNQVLERL